MKKLLCLMLMVISSLITNAQCDSISSIITLKSLNSEVVYFELCNKDTLDFLIVKQIYTTQQTTTPVYIDNAELGNYLLRNNRIILFTTDNSKFQLKLTNEEKFFDVDSDEVIVYSYYEANRNKIKYILLGSVETIKIIKEDRIQDFELTHTESIQFYQMAYQYFKWKKWKN